MKAMPTDCQCHRTIDEWRRERIAAAHGAGVSYGSGRSDVTLLAYCWGLSSTGGVQGFRDVELAVRESWLHCGLMKTVIVTDQPNGEMLSFAEKYGPGGKPEYFQLAEISEGGYLTLWLEPWSEEYQKEIQALLPEEYRKGFLFGEGRGRSEQGSSLYDFRMGLVLGRIMQEREPRWQIIQEETFLKEPLENRLRIGYRYEDGRQSAWYSILLKGQEEEWEPFARLRMPLYSLMNSV